MRTNFILAIAALLTVLMPTISRAYQFEPGDEVLTNCRQIYTRGFVKAKMDDGYTIHFPKQNGPINCPPFRWHKEFVVPFQSVPEYHLRFFGGLKSDIVFRKGEVVILRMETDKRLFKNKPTVDIEAEIVDISNVGAIAVKLLSKDPEAAATFWQLVGSNYVDLRHKALEAEIARRSH